MMHAAYSDHAPSLLPAHDSRAVQCRLTALGVTSAVVSIGLLVSLAMHSKPQDQALASPAIPPPSRTVRAARSTQHLRPDPETIRPSLMPRYALRASPASALGPLQAPSAQPQGFATLALAPLASYVAAMAVVIASFVATFRPTASLARGTENDAEQPDGSHGHCQSCTCCAYAGRPLPTDQADEPFPSLAAYASAGAKSSPEWPAEWNVKQDLYDSLLKASEDQTELLSLLRQHWDELARNGKYTTALQQRAEEGDDGAARVLEGMNTIVAKLMEGAQFRLQALTQVTEVNALDKQIINMAEKNEIDMAFLRVLDINIEAAQKDGATDRFTFFTHIRTRCVEEVEKRANPADALISRALRQADAGIRERILEDFLLPKTVIILPSGKELPLDRPAPPKVTVAQFSEAVSDTIARLQRMDVDAALKADAIDDVRQLAKEVRLVIMRHYDEEKVRWYERRLGEVFAPVIAQDPPTP